jgi:uncharacterized membrane protein (DUF373 family)
MKNINLKILSLLTWTSNITHIIISIALITATVLVAAFLFEEIYTAIKVHTLIKGFLHALGILLLLWTMVELINTEIRYLKGGDIDVAVFVEVALIVIVREIILLPVEDANPDWITITMWVGAAASMGLTYLFVRSGQYLLHKRSLPATAE